MHERRTVSKAAPSRSMWLAVVLLGGLTPALPAATGPDGDDHLRKALEGLEIALVHFDELGWAKAHTILERLADETRSAMREREHEHELARERERDGKRRDRETPEHAAVEKQTEALRLALAVLRATELHDATDVAVRALRAREVRLEGWRDDEAHEIRERAPRREQLVEVLVLAEHLYREHDQPDRANRLSRLTEELWPPRERARGPRAGRARARAQHRAGAEERAVARRHLDVMRLGMPALREAGHREIAERLEHAIHARELALEGRRDREAAEIRETAPDRGETIEILAHAARLWREFGDGEKAERLAELAARLGDNRDTATRRERDRPRQRERRGTRQRPDERETLLHHLELLQERVHELARELDELKARVRERGPGLR